MTAFAQIPRGWDHVDHLDGGSVYDLYDAADQHVRKVHLDQQGKKPHEHICLHLHDPTGRTCLIETKTRDNGTSRHPTVQQPPEHSRAAERQES